MGDVNWEKRTVFFGYRGREGPLTPSQRHPSEQNPSTTVTPQRAHTYFSKIGIPYPLRSPRSSTQRPTKVTFWRCFSKAFTSFGFGSKRNLFGTLSR